MLRMYEMYAECQSRLDALVKAWPGNP